MLAIRNYGHFWSREYVNWGKRNSVGQLLGYRMEDREPFVVDFREQIGIYMLFDENREAVYVGQAGAGDQRLLIRIRQHTRDALRSRWSHFSWFGFRGVNATREPSNLQQPDSRCFGTHLEGLNEIESVLLQVIEPRLNKRGPNWGNDTYEYLQYLPWDWDKEEPLPMKQDIAALYSKLTEIDAQLGRLKPLVEGK